MDLKVFCNDEKLLPSFCSKKACAMDLKASGCFITCCDTEKKEIFSEDFCLKKGERVLIKTGLFVSIPKSCWGNIRSRSGLALNNGIIVLGGVIDEDYRGEIGVILYNSSKKDFVIKKYDRIAQLIIQKYFQPRICLVKKLGKTERGEKGFGSTGK